MKLLPLDCTRLYILGELFSLFALDSVQWLRKTCRAAKQHSEWYKDQTWDRAPLEKA